MNIALSWKKLQPRTKLFSKALCNSPNRLTQAAGSHSTLIMINGIIIQAIILHSILFNSGLEINFFAQVPAGD